MEVLAESRHTNEPAFRYVDQVVPAGVVFSCDRRSSPSNVQRLGSV